jgi:hypothetical protein
MTYIYLPMKMEKTECSEKLVYKIQTPGNYPEENIQISNIFVIYIFKITKVKFTQWHTFTGPECKWKYISYSFATQY